MRSSGEAVLGLVLQREGVQTSNRCFAHSLSWFLNGLRGGVVGWVGMEGWLRGSAHPSVVLCAGITRRTLLLLQHLRNGSWGLVFLYLIVCNFPQLCAVIFSPF